MNISQAAVYAISRQQQLADIDYQKKTIIMWLQTHTASILLLLLFPSIEKYQFA